MISALRHGLCILALSATAAQALASPPLQSPRPKARPFTIVIGKSAEFAPYVSPRPRKRPSPVKARSSARDAITTGLETVVVKQTITEDIIVREAGKERVAVVASRRPVIVTSPFAVGRSPQPKKRPRKLRVARAETDKPIPVRTVKYKRTGSVCGVRGIRGYSVGRVSGKIKGCRISNPVKVTEIDGVKLTREALIGCDAAKSLYTWVNRSAKPTVGRKGGGLAKIQVIAGYSCRTRNSKRGAKLSEHAKGNAIDIAGFVLKNGKVLSVERDWRSGSKSRTLKKLHKSACGPFGTVLGPNADRYHRDHFHFDVARYRSGTYCR
ncbi:MAG: extensin family protein [Rhodobacteraceae bacterium]|nr:extensin family protein [Paracoccaceae bacterium]